MKKANTLTLAQLGIFSGLIILLTFTPLGYLTIGPISATTIHIPVIIGAIVLGPKSGTILGGVMGVFCLIRAATMPVGPLDVLFINPVISVLPRILIGLVAALVFIGLKKVMKGKASTAVSAGIAAAAGTLTNTIFVLGLLVLFYSEQIQVSASGAVSFIILTILSVNGIAEIVGAVVLAIPISIALLKMKERMTTFR